MIRAFIRCVPPIGFPYWCFNGVDRPEFSAVLEPLVYASSRRKFVLRQPLDREVCLDRIAAL
jgi:hypothetical protein